MAGLSPAAAGSVSGSGRVGTPGRCAGILLAALVLCSLGLSGCSRSSETTALDHDSSDDTVAGPRPTAPPPTRLDEAGLSVDAVALIGELRKLEAEDDLCTILTSETVKSVLDADFDASGLVTSPSGLSQMLIAVDSFFSHIVAVSPAPISASTRVVQQAWEDVASIDADATDRQKRTDAILQDPAVAGAFTALGDWIRGNCALSGGLPLGG